MLLGSTFAWFNYIASQSLNGTIVTSGTLSINYQDGSIIEADALIPADEPAYNALCNDNLCYKNAFTISNNGSLDAVVKGSLKIETNNFPNGVLKYKVMDNNTLVTVSSNIPLKNEINLFNGLTLTGATGTKTYTLFIWLDNSASNESQGKNMTGTIEIQADQVGIIYVPFAPTLLNEDDTPMEGTATLHSNPITVPINSEGVADFGYVSTGEHSIIVNSPEKEEKLNDTIILLNGNENIIVNKHITILEKSLMKIVRNESKKKELIAPLILCPEDAPINGNGYCEKLAIVTQTCDSGTLSGNTCSLAATTEYTCASVGGSLNTTNNECYKAANYGYICTRTNDTLNTTNNTCYYKQKTANCIQNTCTNITLPPNGWSCITGYTMTEYENVAERGFLCSKAATQGYLCDESWTLSGTQCYKEAATSYSCVTGWTKSGTTCIKTSTPVYSCEDGWTVSNINCIKEPGN